MAVIIDSYSEANGDATRSLGASGVLSVSQSFTGNGSILETAKFLMLKEGSPTGSAVAKIFNHSGTFGTSSVPTGSAIATSNNFDVSTLTSDWTLTTLTFSGVNNITLVNGTKYVVTIEWSGGNSSNNAKVQYDGSSGTHAGNIATFVTLWTVSSTKDLVFYVYGSATSVSASVSASVSSSASSSVSSSKSSSVSASVSISASISSSVSSSVSISSSVSSSPSIGISVSSSVSASVSSSASASVSSSVSTSVSSSISSSASISSSSSSSKSASISSSVSSSTSSSISSSASSSPSSGPVSLRTDLWVVALEQIPSVSSSVSSSSSSSISSSVSASASSSPSALILRHAVAGVSQFSPVINVKVSGRRR